MKSFSKILSAVLIILLGSLGLNALVLHGFGTPSAEALFTPSPIEDLIKTAGVLFASLIGIPALLAAALSLLEYLGKVTHGQSDVIQMYANAILYLAAFIAVFFGQTEFLSMIDKYIGGLAPIVIALLSLLSGGVFSVIQTRNFSGHIRSLYPIRLKLTIK